MSGVDRRLSDLPATTDVPRFLEAVKTLLQTRDPQVRTVGDILDKYLTRRELVELGLASFEGLRLAGGGEADRSTPPMPMGFTVVGGVGGVILSWIAPTYTAGGGNGYTEILAAEYDGAGPLPVFADAVVIGSAVARTALFVDSRPIETERHYWIRFVTENGVAGEAAGGENGADIVAEGSTPTEETVRLTSDRTTTSSALTSVSQFFLRLQPSSTYLVTGLLRVRTGALANGYQLGISVPSDWQLTLRATCNTSETASETRQLDIDVGDSTGDIEFSSTFGADKATPGTYSSTADALVRFEALVTTGSVGSFQLRHASPDGSNTVRTMAGSIMLGRRVDRTGESTPAILEAAPGFSSPYTYARVLSGGAAVTARITLDILRAGTWQVTRTGGAVLGSGNWADPTSADVGQVFQVRFVISGSNGLGVVSNGAAAWQTVNITRACSISVTCPPLTTRQDDIVVSIQMRELGDPIATTIATITLDCTAQSIP